MSIIGGLGIALFITGCASTVNELPKQENPAIIGGYTQQINFNYVADQNLSTYDARYQSILMVARQNPSAVAVIRFNDINAKKFSQNLGDMLAKDGIKSELIGYADKANQAKVGVYIRFKPLDKVLKPIYIAPTIQPTNTENKITESSTTIISSSNESSSGMTNITNLINNK